jgi:(p)ppGpp synthase/HD superfamily hydrolase
MEPTRLTPRFQLAMTYAFLLHANQRRKGSDIPYVGHLLGTAALVLHHGGDEDQAVAALLHDAVEDQGGVPTLQAIERGFGSRVAAIVEACTDAFAEPKPPWRERKERYVEALPGKRRDALLVSAADKLDNARAIVMDLRMAGDPTPSQEARDAMWQRFNGKKDGSLWYYAKLVEVFRQLSVGPIVDELDVTVTRMKALAGG